eukprot:scaffold30965_cov58-Phaeocystis_antarctica.AAC.1
MMENTSFCERRRRQPPTRAPYLRLRRKRGGVQAQKTRAKKSGPVCLSSPNRATESPESCELRADNRTPSGLLAVPGEPLVGKPKFRTPLYRTVEYW